MRETFGPFNAASSPQALNVHSMHTVHAAGTAAQWSVSSIKMGKDAAKLLEAIAPSLAIITQERAMGRSFGPFDFTVVLCPYGAQRRLEIEVDGEQHSKKEYYGTTVLEQKTKDAAKEEQAWREGRSVVRLHHADHAQWREKLRRAFAYASRRRALKFIMFTQSYGRSSKVALKD